jgi:hypothetical protein
MLWRENEEERESALFTFELEKEMAKKELHDFFLLLLPYIRMQQHDDRQEAISSLCRPSNRVLMFRKRCNSPSRDKDAFVGPCLHRSALSLYNCTWRQSV